MIKAWSIALAWMGLLLFAPLGAHAQPAKDGLTADLAAFADWFPGRWDNDLQVFFQKENNAAADAQVERIHSIFRRVELPAFGSHVFYVEQYLNGDPARIYRQRIYTLAPDAKENALRMVIHIPPKPEAIVGAWRDPAKLKDLTPADMRTYPGCDVLWRRKGEAFTGVVPKGACRVQSSRTGKTLVVMDDLKLTPSELWIQDRAVDEAGAWVYGNRAGVAHKLKKARPFQCWAGVLRGAKHGDAGEGAKPADWFFRRDVVLHDQGGVALITTDETPPRGVELKLRAVEWPSGPNRPSLTLYVHEAGAARALSYAWTELDAERVGINLRWMQASCTHTPDAAFK